MTPLIDLHTHSSFSDGALSPSSLVAQAGRLGITTLSLTDHDTINGLGEAMTAGQNMGLEVVAGIEISALFQDLHLHILGYGFSPGHEGLVETVREIQQARVARNRKIIAKLQQMGKAISLDEMERQEDQQVGRPHIARLLVSKGYARNTEEAFRLFLRDNGPAYVSGHKLTAEQAIDVINAAGGLAVLAHPGKLPVSGTTLASLVRSLAAHGLAGLEIYYPRHAAKTVRKLRKLAERFNLAATGGSDFHGLSSHGDQLGGGTGSPSYPAREWSRFKSRLAQVSTI